ncbi:MAG: hypothetical protein J6R49_00290, partial [Clostridia bacterium]|nr:hypothetical protein [Clostridia bacterium]
IAIQPPITDEQLRSMPLYALNTSYAHYIHLPDMPQYYWPELGDPAHRPYVEECNGTEIEYYGETYTINSFVYYNSTDFLSSFYYADEKKLIGFKSRDHGTLKYDSVTKEPLEMKYFKNYEPYDISDSDIEMEDVKARIELFVEDVLNDKYEKGIDLDNYEFEMDSSASGIHFLNYYFNDVLIHTIRIYLSETGNVKAWTCHPVPSKDVISRIPNISKEQLEELVISTCTEQYAKMGESVVASFPEGEAVLPHVILIYNAPLGGYMIQISGRILLEHSNGVKENKQFDFAMPLMNE